MAYTLEYSSKDSSIVWAGAPLVGLAPDSGISITKNEDDTDEEVGMDGRTVVSISPNDSVIVTLTFQQEGQGYKDLMSLREDQKANKYLLREPMIISLNTGEKYYIDAAHMKTVPERNWGSTATGSSRAFGFYGTIAKYSTSGTANFNV
jgi:hypothetical protein